MKEEKKKILIIDGNNLLYSSYFAFQKLPWKMPGGAIFLFLRVLISILKKNNYQKLLVTFDGGGVNFRKSLLPQYKAHRLDIPTELWEQMQELKLLLEKTNIVYIQLVNWEADDLIASFIAQNNQEYPNVVFDIFTRDKDLLQLISDNTNILKYENRKIILYTQKQFYQEYNFSPSHYVGYLSLLGDKVDNIEGVKGIGPINAKKLIQQFQTPEIIYQKIENLPENIKKLLADKKEIVFNNQKIISLEKNVPLPEGIYEKCDFCWEKWKSNKELQNFCSLNRFTSILKSLD